MEWTQDLSVGVEKIDSQHRELFKRINKLVDAIKQSRCKDEIDDTIRFLEEYAAVHFAEEEKFMKETNYADYQRHKAHHSTYLAALAALKQEAALPRAKGSSYDLSVMTNQIVVDWIIDHILKIDRKFGEFLRGTSDSK